MCASCLHCGTPCSFLDIEHLYFTFSRKKKKVHQSSALMRSYTLVLRREIDLRLWLPFVLFGGFLKQGLILYLRLVSNFLGISRLVSSLELTIYQLQLLKSWDYLNVSPSSSSIFWLPLRYLKHHPYLMFLFLEDAVTDHCIFGNFSV